MDKQAPHPGNNGNDTGRPTPAEATGATEGLDNQAPGPCAHAEGMHNRAATPASHVEGRNNAVEHESEYSKHADSGHAEGLNTLATGWQAHAEGGSCWAEALICHAQNCVTLAAGNDSHAEGVQTVTGRRRYFIRPEDQGMEPFQAMGDKPFFIVRCDPEINPAGDYTDEFVARTIKIQRETRTASPCETSPTWWRYNTVILFSTAELRPLKFTVLESTHDPDRGLTRIVYDHDRVAFPEPQTIMMACASYAPEGGDSTYSDGKGQHAEGKRTNASGNFAHAEGRDTTCFGRYSHAEGYRTKVTGDYGAHAEGEATAALGNRSHAEGADAQALGNAAHAEGRETVAAGDYAHAEGDRTHADGEHSHAGGRGTVARHAGSQIMGRYGETDRDHAWHLAAGIEGSPALACRIDADGVHHTAGFRTGGCAYAELFEWADGNPDGEDRAGRFATLDGDKILKAQGAADYMLGVITTTPAVAGDAAELRWHGRDVRDDLGRPPHEQAEGLADGGASAAVGAAHDPTAPYRPRSQRTEWATVGLLGKLLVRDNGTCQVNGTCASGRDGIAVPSEQGYRVLARLAPNVIRILFR